MDKNEVKKQLYKSKANASFSHYSNGDLFYTVELEEGIFQFPIPVVDDVPAKIVTGDSSIVIGSGPKEYTLSADLGITNFYREMKGSELNRWISKAIDKNEFIKITA